MNYRAPGWPATVRHLWRDDSHRIFGLDLLRTAAITAVVLFHYSQSRSFAIPFARVGWVGVDLFFVLSGYLIGGQLLGLHQKQPSIPFKTFYIRRFLRTLPSYYVVLAFYLIVPALSTLTSKEKLVFLWQYVTFTQNLPRSLPLFQISWSLCVEEHFYLLLPLIVGLALNRKRKGIHWIFPLVILVELIVRASILFHGRQNLRLENSNDALAYMTYIYYPTYCRLDGLTLGVALATLHLYRPKLCTRLMAHGNQLLLAGVITLVGAFLLMSTKLYLLVGTINFTVMGVAFSLITASALSGRSLISRVRLRAVTILAELSYSIYLTHFIALILADAALSRLGLSGYHWLSFIFTMATVLVLATALFVLVERPCLRFRDRFFAYKKPEALTHAAGDVSVVEAQHKLPGPIAAA